MSRLHSWSLLLGLSAAVLVSVLLLSGCEVSEEHEQARPNEATYFEPITNPSAVALVSGPNQLLYASGRIWSLDEGVPTVRAVLSRDYRVSGVNARTYEPSIAADQFLGRRLALIGSGVDVVSDGSGNSRRVAYEEVVLVDPADPFDRDSVIKVPGRILTVHCFQTHDTRVEAIAVHWEPTGAAGSRARLDLYTRSGDGPWSQTWSADEGVAGEPFVPAYCGFGFGDALADAPPALYVIGWHGRQTEADVRDRRLSMVRVSLEDDHVSLKIADLEHKRVEYLCRYNDGGRNRPAFVGFDGDDAAGVILIGGETGTPRVVDLGGWPLLVVGSGDGRTYGLARGRQADGEGLRIVELGGSSEQQVLDGVVASWASPVFGGKGEPDGVALVGFTVPEPEAPARRLWSVWMLTFDDGGAPHVVRLVKDWRTRGKQRIAAVAGLFGENGDIQRMILSIDEGYGEGGLAVVPVEEQTASGLACPRVRLLECTATTYVACDGE